MLTFAVRVLPLYLAALALTLAGWAVRAPQAWLAPVAVCVVLLFVALLTFRRTPTWSTILLLGLALTAGAALRLVGGARIAWVPSSAAALGAPLVGAAIGGRFRLRRAWVRGSLWTLAWIYILGAWLFPVEPGNLRAWWAGAGLLVFAGLAVIWFADWPAREARDPAGGPAAELYLIGLNLALAANALASA
jgi:hypothetical protein